jgi:HPr kinase/phosphorylase
MALGAELVSDDRTVLMPEGDALVATCPAPIAGMIEARGVGLLAAHNRERAPVLLVIDLDQIEKARLPDPREVEIAGCVITCLHKIDAASFPAAIVQLMKGGRVNPT